MRIFAYALRPYDELGYLDALSRELGFDYDWTPDYPTLENAGLAAGADGVCIITNPMSRELLSRYRALGVHGLATRSIGFEHIDVAAARELGIRVAHAAYPPEGVANFTIMLMLMALRKVKLFMAQAAVQNFDLEGKIGRDLSSCTVGVVGTGAIGACVVRHLRGFGCRVLACDPVEKDELRGMATYVSLGELLASSDVVTLHAPGLPENHHMIGAAELAAMRRGAILVNAARGSLVDTEALLGALESGHLGGAALDTIEHEQNLYYLDRSLDVLPNRDRAALSALPNVIVSPHMAFYTNEDVEGMVRSNVEALMAFAAGNENPYEVR
ncbi:D-isomer specific 2-hydroxyacid dehydrogenase family protein [Thermophilibacter provencensis]|uniref:D-isomer specific 2-hydroxyacid dehydrogenase family protein n=1 Tax=Thermophilibacter provencensis TaxID=1852386 RepID=A0ABT7V3A0_9ACTN|nr:D-isomer specific 2-hydroxyacid dehydrogenase family protein [Thermophilibacter provencensis]MDM8271058.1 D-isomer specific 2-hydroxyacid dehydrogenase family protein [Thermophilibacter provencensis]